jgi:hypothetical protein
MKKLLLILIGGMTLFSSCMKEVREVPGEKGMTDRQGNEHMKQVYGDVDREIFDQYRTQARGRDRNQFYHTIAKSYKEHTQGAEGFAFEVPIEKLSLNGGMTKSCWAAMYVEYLDTNSVLRTRWFQVGYGVDKFGLFPAFYGYELTPQYSQVPPPIIYYPEANTPIEYTNEPVRFEMRRKPNTTWWIIARGGIDRFEANLGITHLRNIEIATESRASDRFSNILKIEYLDFFRDGVWHHVPTGYTSTQSWGIYGRNQNPSLRISQVLMGGALNTPYPGLLWNQ